ncbi:MAG: oxidoreductase [Gammaproteobacteria bacterium]
MKGNTTTKTALLLGASGLVGGHCVKLLLENASYHKVIAWVRKPIPLQHAKLLLEVVDFEHLDRHASTLGEVSEVFCCLGTTIKKAGSQDAFYRVDFVYPYEIAQMAARNEVQQFLIVTAMSADPGSSIFYNRVKGEVEAALAKLPFRGLQILRPSLLLGERQEFRLGERVGIFASKRLSFLFVGRLRKYRAIEASVVAYAMVQIAQQNVRGVNIFESWELQAIAAGK